MLQLSVTMCMLDSASCHRVDLRGRSAAGRLRQYSTAVYVCGCLCGERAGRGRAYVGGRASESQECCRALQAIQCCCECMQAPVVVWREVWLGGEGLEGACLCKGRMQVKSCRALRAVRYCGECMQAPVLVWRKGEHGRVRLKK